jgi:hypothetical protein
MATIASLQKRDMRIGVQLFARVGKEADERIVLR